MTARSHTSHVSGIDDHTATLEWLKAEHALGRLTDVTINNKNRHSKIDVRALAKLHGITWSVTRRRLPCIKGRKRHDYMGEVCMWCGKTKREIERGVNE